MPTHQRANLAVFNAGRDGMHQVGIPLRGQAHGQAHPNGRIGIGGHGVKQGFAAQNADTFAEFEARVRSFMVNMETMPDGTVVFGHGIWFGLLHWLSLGYRVSDAGEMRAFRRFQQALPMPNCATFVLAHAGGQRWSIQADTTLTHRIAAIKNPDMS